MTTKKIALFIDADNISARFGKQIIDALENRGEIFIRRIYGNWEKFSLHGWNDCILNFSLRAMQQPDFVAGKNATDMSLTIDAMDVLHDGKAEIFALASNDSDFTPLAIRLREGGMNVIGLGNAQVANSFRAACNDFINLDVTEKIMPVEEPLKVEKKSPPVKKFSPQMSLFDEENIIAPKPKTSKVVPIINQSQSAPKNPLQTFHDILRETARIRGDENGFVLLNCAGQNIHDRKLDLKVSGHSKLSKFISAFPNLYEVKGNGPNISYRCR